jgi:hypothetical protein
MPKELEHWYEALEGEILSLQENASGKLTKERQNPSGKAECNSRCKNLAWIATKNSIATKHSNIRLGITYTNS